MPDEAPRYRVWGLDTGGWDTGVWGVGSAAAVFYPFFIEEYLLYPPFSFHDPAVAVELIIPDRDLHYLSAPAVIFPVYAVHFSVYQGVCRAYCS